MTNQTFHLTGLDPRSALCGRNGHIWAAPHWPDEREMRAGRFGRCKDCDRQATPALLAALESARELERATLTAFKTGWRDGCGLPAEQTEPASADTYNAVRECRDLGRRVGAEAARRIREAEAGDRRRAPAGHGGNAAPTP